MKKAICRILPVLAVALVIASISGIAIAQDDVQDTAFQINYYSNNAGTIRIVNDGAQGGIRGSFNRPSAGTLCAMVYAYTADQQMAACCGCLVTPNGLQAINVKTQLLGNPGIFFTPGEGPIKILASAINSSASASSSAGNLSALPTAVAADNSQYCDPSVAPTLPNGLVSWATHVQNTAGTIVTETESQNGTLSASEEGNLLGVCGNLLTNGSGHGVCDCGPFEK